MTGGGPDAVATDDDLTAEDPLGVDVQRSNGASVIRLGGEIDMLTPPALRAKVNEELQGKPSVLVLDMLSVEFLGSSGLALLVEALDESRNRDVALRLPPDPPAAGAPPRRRPAARRELAAGEPAAAGHGAHRPVRALPLGRGRPGRLIGAGACR